MKFELFVVGALLCATLSKCDEKWCVEKKESQILTYRPTDDSAAFATERVISDRQIWVCCPGYQPLGKDCVPICVDSCPESQKCIKPGVCGCGDGYYLNGDTCQPSCENNCKNGVCEGENCVCKERYRLNQETMECEPTCNLDCGPNAHCSMSGGCECNLGFFRNELDSCQSWCTTPCKNGDCSGLNKCTCHKGFVMVDGMCIPDCKLGCMFGDCVSNEMCVCWAGYVYNSTTRNCQEGNLYRTPTTTAYPRTNLLQKQTDKPCPEYCPNGECINGICKCGQGLVRADHLCAMHCGDCQFGQCVEESLCRRLDRIGADTSAEVNPENSYSASSSTEEPLETSTCATGCWGGTCVNGECQCTDGLVLNSENDCVRPCEKYCKMGVCTENNTCLCLEGYVLKNGTECVPVCDKSCENGFCITPNKCECHEGYMHSLATGQEHICMPTCDGQEGNEGCINGTCIGVNKCQCFEGLIFKPNNRFECEAYPVDVAEVHQKRSWYIYLLLGILMVLLMIILLLLVIRKLHQDTYNVEKVEKHPAELQYHSV